MISKVSAIIPFAITNAIFESRHFLGIIAYNLEHIPLKPGRSLDCK